MSVLPVVLNVLVLALLLLGLYVLQRRHWSFTTRVFTGLAAGILFGVALQNIYGPTNPDLKASIDWFNLVANGYVQLLQMVGMPLIFISILAAFTRLTLVQNAGKIGGLVIGLLLGTTAIAAAIGIALAGGFGLHGFQIEQGQAEAAAITRVGERLTSVQQLSVPQRLLTLLPTNVFQDLTGSRSTSTIAVVVFGVLLGIAFLRLQRKQPEEAQFFGRLINSLYALIMQVVTLVLRLTPYGVLALMTRFVATSDFAQILKLGQFVVAIYIAMAIMFGIHLLLIALSGLNPITYIRKALPALTFAFTSRTSAGTMPMTLRTLNSEFGLSHGISNFAASFGLSIGQNGCAGIYPAMLAVMVAPAAGIDPFTPTFILSLIAVVAISSFGVAGVGGGATYASLMVLSTLNLPIAIVGLLISVEALVDMGRTALNVSGSMTAGVLTGRVLGELDREVYVQPRQLVEATA